jgi:hypothetical protein
MGGARRLRIARPDDWLYRLVKPEQWDEQGLLPDAFDDQHQDLSLFLQRVKSPVELLTFFAQFGPARKLCKTRRPTPALMYSAGFRIAAIRLGEFLAAGYEIKTDAAGNHFDDKGHLEIIRGQRNAAVWASRAQILSREEILGE